MITPDPAQLSQGVKSQAGLPQTGQASQIQLHDIHLPEQVSNFPIAPGWWILIVLFIISAFLIYRQRKAKTLLNADKNKALSILASNKSLNSKECIALLKWVAMQYFNREQLAKMYGDDFQVFLINQLPEKHQTPFKELSSSAFKIQYQADHVNVIDIDSSCHQAAILWITNALPIKEVVTSSIFNKELRT